MATENKSKWPIFILLIAAALFILFILVIWKYGALGLITVLKNLFIFVLILTIMGLIVAAVIWLFKKHRKQMVYIMKNEIIRTSRINNNDFKQILRVKGGIPMGGRELGEIIGYAMIKSGIKKAYDGNGGLIELEKPKDVVFITFSNGGKIKQFIDGVNIFAGIWPEDFANGLNNEVVLIEDDGYSITPTHFGMIWCAKHWKKKHLIEETAKETIYRYVVEDNLNDIKAVIDKAVLVDPKDEGESLIQQAQKGAVEMGGDK